MRYMILLVFSYLTAFIMSVLLAIGGLALLAGLTEVAFSYRIWPSEAWQAAIWATACFGGFFAFDLLRSKAEAEMNKLSDRY